MAELEQITRLLNAYAAGDSSAMDRVVPLLYAQLRAIAHHRLMRERRDHTLSTTGLVNEAYIELVKWDVVEWKNRGHFLAAASHAMRNVLVDYAVSRNAQKRGGGQTHVALDDAEHLFGEVTDGRLEEVLALDEALKRLAAERPRWVQVVECRCFAGLNIEETAQALGVSHGTVSNDWRMARAWLKRELA